MRSKLVGLLFHIRASFWFIPAILAGTALAGALFSVNFDETSAARSIADWLPFPQIGTEGARLVVSTIAGSMITVASLVFSLTLIALTLMSQQLGPRILPIFMTDRATQVVLGYFVATFLFSLMVLSTIGSGEKGQFVPQLSVYVACFLAITAFALMIFFVHHIARSIQADSVVAALADTLDAEIEKLRCTETAAVDKVSARAPDPAHEDSDAQSVLARKSGYIQMIDYDGGVKLARECDILIRYERGPGHYVVKGSEIGRVTGKKLNDGQLASLCDTVSIGRQRTPAQQIDFEFNTLLEVAVRALSPGVNDPFTAITCIDHLTDALSRVMSIPVAGRDDFLSDEDGNPRVRRYVRSFDQYMTQVMHPLRQSAARVPQVLHRLAEALRTLHELCHRAEARPIIEAHAALLAEDCRREVKNPSDRDDILSILEPLGL